MENTDIEVIREKLILLGKYLEELSELKGLTFKEYMERNIIKRGAERLLQLLVEVASDINGAILTDKGEIPPDSYYDSFVKAGNSGAISVKLSKEVAPTAGLRNRLVHEYGEYKDSIVFRNIRKMLRLYKQYMKEITIYLQRVDKGAKVE